MAGKPKYKNPPARPENQWLRDALEYSGMSQAALADRLTLEGVGTYGRSNVQKMTVGQRITLETASAISRVTGFPIPDGLYGEEDRSPSADPVPLISWVSAGHLTEQDGVISLEEYPRIHVADLPPGRWIALRVSGTSMNKISPPESVIIVNLDDHRLISGKCYVIADETGAATYKAFDPQQTPPFQPRSYVDHDAPDLVGEIRVIGRVYRTMLDL